MDPDVTLAQLRLRATDALTDDNPPRWAELFQDLDSWMTAGGFPPAAWAAWVAPPTTTHGGTR